MVVRTRASKAICGNGWICGESGRGDLSPLQNSLEPSSSGRLSLKETSLIRRFASLLTGSYRPDHSWICRSGSDWRCCAFCIASGHGSPCGRRMSPGRCTGAPHMGIPRLDSCAETRFRCTGWHAGCSTPEESPEETCRHRSGCYMRRERWSGAPTSPRISRGASPQGEPWPSLIPDVTAPLFRNSWTWQRSEGRVITQRSSSSIVEIQIFLDT